MSNTSSIFNKNITDESVLNFIKLTNNNEPPMSKLESFLFVAATVGVLILGSSLMVKLGIEL